MINSFGDRVRTLRYDRQEKEGKEKWSLDALAKRINLTSQTLSNIETNKNINPTLKTIQGLALEFNVSCDFLVFGKETSKKIRVQLDSNVNYYSNINNEIVLIFED